MTVSTRTLNTLAAFVWYVGGITLLIRGSTLIGSAHSIHPHQYWPWVAAVGGPVIGSLRAISVFSRSCRKNLARIAALDQPRVWQFFRPHFFAALIVMIGAGVTLSHVAQHHYPLLIIVATLELSIACGLLVSSYVFWQQKALVSSTP